MPTARIPLVGSFNQRGIDGENALTVNEDQRFLNVTFDVVTNPITGKSTVYVEKRPGWAVDSIVEAGSPSTALIKPQSFNTALSAFGGTNSTIYVGGISVGAITGRALYMTETIISSSSYVAMRSSDGTAWYYAEGAKDNLAYSGHTSSGSATVSTIPDMTGLYSGQTLSSNTIPGTARISTLNYATSSVVLTATATATSTSTLITKTPIAKILDANFTSTGTSISAFSEMDGYLFYTTDDGNLRNSALNTITTFPATAFIAVQMSPDPPVAVARQKNTLVIFGTASKEVFYNAGYASGSPAQRSPQFFDRIGAVDQRSITVIENDIFFVASPTKGDIGVYRIRELQALKISPSHIDTIIGNVSATNGAIYAASLRAGGYPYLVLTLSTASDGPSSNLLLENSDAILLESGDNILLEDTPGQVASFVRQLVYNTQLNIWSEWDASVATFIDGASSGTANAVYATSRFDTGGKVFRIAPTSDGAVYQDNASTYAMEVRTSGLDMGTTKKKYIREIRLVTDQPSSGTAYISYSDDDYRTWSTPRAVDLSQTKPGLHRLGAHRGKRAWKIAHSSNAAFRASALEIDYDVGLS